MASRAHRLEYQVRRVRPLLETILWAAVVLGGIIFFFWLIWNPPV